MRGIWLLIALLGCVSCTGRDAGPVPTDGSDSNDDSGLTEPDSPTLSVVLNEVMPGNQSTVDSPNGLKSDWIELVNTGSEAVPLSKLQLRNGSGERWSGPATEELAAGGRLLIWADDEAYSVDHSTGFTLDKDGDELTLLDEEDRVLDHLDLDAVDSDLSYARIPDGTGELTLTAWPTPNAENDAIASPTLNPADETVFIPYEMHVIEFTFTPEALNRIDHISRPEVHVALEIDGVSYLSLIHI